MAYHVVYSKHPFLLARLCTELQMMGCKMSDFNNENGRHPFENVLNDYHGEQDKLTVNDPDVNGLAFWSIHLTNFVEFVRWHLTEKSYLTVLKAIVNDI